MTQEWIQQGARDTTGVKLSWGLSANKHVVKHPSPLPPRLVPVAVDDLLHRHAAHAAVNLPLQAVGPPASTLRQH